MSKTYKEFGGWLKVFQLVNIFCLVLVLLYFVSTAYLVSDYFSSGKPFTIELKLTTVFMFTLFPALFFFYAKILKTVKVQSLNVPETISTYLKYILVISVTAGMAEIIFCPPADSSKLIYAFTSSVLQPLVLNIAWILYFRKSVRVREFYGCNASESGSLTGRQS